MPRGKMTPDKWIRFFLRLAIGYPGHALRGAALSLISMVTTPAMFPLGQNLSPQAPCPSKTLKKMTGCPEDGKRD